MRTHKKEEKEGKEKEGAAVLQAGWVGHIAGSSHFHSLMTMVMSHGPWING